MESIALVDKPAPQSASMHPSLLCRVALLHATTIGFSIIWLALAFEEARTPTLTTLLTINL